MTVRGLQREMLQLLEDNGVPATIRNNPPGHYRSLSGRFSEPGPGGPPDSTTASPNSYVNVVYNEDFDKAVEIVSDAFGPPAPEMMGYIEVEAIRVGGVRIIILPPTEREVGRFGIVDVRSGRRSDAGPRMGISESNLRKIIKEELARELGRKR
jgi:hypothetical protein